MFGYTKSKGGSLYDYVSYQDTGSGGKKTPATLRRPFRGQGAKLDVMTLATNGKPDKNAIDDFRGNGSRRRTPQ